MGVGGRLTLLCDVVRRPAWIHTQTFSNLTEFDVADTDAVTRRRRLVAGERMAIQKLAREGCRAVQTLEDLRDAFAACDRPRFDDVLLKV